MAYIARHRHNFVNGFKVMRCYIAHGKIEHRVEILAPRGGCLILMSEATMLANRGHLHKLWIASILQAHKV